MLPSILLRPVLRILGCRIGKGVKIGFSLIYCDSLELGSNVTIGHFNLFAIKNIDMASGAKVGYLNICKGPFDLNLHTDAAIGNRNYMTRGPLGLTYGPSSLTLGELTKITTGHHVDLTRSITIGDFSIVAGIRSQLWTHGYYHGDKGRERIRIDGEITIGNNVYIGSGCIFNPGVTISDAIHVGAGSALSKNLTESGMYVNQSLRHIPKHIDTIRERLVKVDDDHLVEDVYKKN